MAKTYSLYFAGELFSAKHLFGNAALAEAISQRSQRRYQSLLPQDLEQRNASAQSIRDQDIRALLACDIGLFNYDGPELDSGTVVEFLFAKFADIPSILLRTDFRNSGDQLKDGDPWNLMSSFFPRTRVITFHGMALYQQGLNPETTPPQPGESQRMAAARAMIERMADEIVRTFDELISMPPVMPPDAAETIYRWLALMPGYRGMAPGQGPVEELLQLCAEKRQKGLL
jgi:nucleoside 2-deoxyribosyltransferase